MPGCIFALVVGFIFIILSFVLNVLQSGTHNRVALTWLYVEEVNAEIKFAIHADASSLLNVL